MTSVPAWAQALLALFGAIGGLGGIVALVKAWPESRKFDAEAEKADADAADVIQRAALALLVPLEQRLHAATTEAADLRGQVAKLTTEVQQLRGQVAQLTADGQSLTDRLDLAHQQLSAHGIPYPPIHHRR